MKEYIVKWIKRYGVTVWLIAAVIGLVASVSYAAYVNLDVEKWVLSTGKGKQAFFSSNYLYLVDRDENAYSERRVVKSSEETQSVVVKIFNHVYGDQSMVNLDDISYTFTVTLQSNGGSLPSDLQNITVSDGTDTWSFATGLTVTFPRQGNVYTLKGGTPQNNEFTFTIPTEIADRVRFQVVAQPNNPSYGATNDQKLAALITMAQAQLVNDWTGRFIDNSDVAAPKDYSGFNYEISGVGEGTLTLTWDKSLTISPWFKLDNNLEEETADGTKWKLTMEVGGKDGEERPSAYQLQFYKADKAFIDGCSWEQLKSLVTVDFSKA